MAFKKAAVDPLRIINPDPTKAIVYLRVSKDLNQQELGGEAQRRSCEAWAKARNIQILEVVEDEISGFTKLKKRKQLLRALELMHKHNAQILLCSKVDRFGRNLLEALLARVLLEERGGKLAFAEGMSPMGDPASELLFNTMLTFAQYELSMIRARTSDARKVLKSRGLYPGGQVPFGYRKVKRHEEGPWYIEPDEQEQAALKRARELLADGYSWGACSRILTREKLLTSSRVGEDGRAVSPATLWRIFRKDFHNDIHQGAPFGYRLKEGELVDHEGEQSVLAMVVKLHQLGVGLHAIASMLKKQGVLTRAGKPPSWYWVRQQIERFGAQGDGPALDGEVAALPQDTEAGEQEAVAPPPEGQQ